MKTYYIPFLQYGGTLRTVKNACTNMSVALLSADELAMHDYDEDALDVWRIGYVSYFFTVVCPCRDDAHMKLHMVQVEIARLTRLELNNEKEIF